MCAVINAVLYVTVCVISEPISSVKCILLSFVIADTIPSHFYAVIFRVCFVFCSCHLPWFHQLLKLIGQNSEPVWGVFNRKPSSALVRAETLSALRCIERRVSRLPGSSWGSTRRSERARCGALAEPQPARSNPELCSFPSCCPVSSGELLRNDSRVLGLLGLRFSRTRRDQERSSPFLLLRL